MNSDLTPVQNSDSTNNPQAAQSSPGASNSTDFQQSAGIEVLKQNRPLQVISTGQPLKVTAPAHNMSASAIVFIIVSTIVLLMIASSVFRWIMKRPEPEPVKPVVKKVKSAKPVVEFVKPLGKKKLPRSKRHAKK